MCLREGMSLGKNIYGPNGEIFLKRNTKLNRRYIKRLTSLGYNGIYIEDGISEGIDSHDIVDEQLRNDTVQKVKHLYSHCEDNTKTDKIEWDALSGLLNYILDEMLSKNDLVYNMVDLKAFDDYTFHHCVNVAILATATGIQMELKRSRIYDLCMAAVMHDVGKIYLPKEVLNKPGKLTDEEFAEVKMHSLRGYNYLKETHYISLDACKGVLSHHERHDGLGYPNGIGGDEINEIGKILAICDVYDALTSDRPYRKAWSPSEAIEYLMGNSGVRFNPEVTTAFLMKIVPYPVGTIVKLSDGKVGIVIKNFIEMKLRPVVRIFEDNGEEVDPYEINLSRHDEYLNVTIEKTVQM